MAVQHHRGQHMENTKSLKASIDSFFHRSLTVSLWALNVCSEKLYTLSIVLIFHKACDFLYSPERSSPIQSNLSHVLKVTMLV